MAPVRRRDLLVLAVGLAVAVWLLVRAYYGDLPPLHWYLPVPLGLIAVAEALGARTLRSRLADERAARSGRDPGPGQSVAQVRPVEQASAWVGAGFAGIWAGVLAYAAPELGRLQSASGDTVTGALGLVCAAGLVVAALWLESVCRVPPSGDDEGPGADARA
jgi:hypothetical protein